MYKNIILHIPHSSADFSFAGEPAVSLFSAGWLRQARNLIDWYTDELFVPDLFSESIVPVIFDTCRTLCDVERMCHDPLEEKGLGITYYPCLATPSGVFNPRHSREEDARFLQKYLDHQYRIASLLVQRPESLLLDCHSFSSIPTLLQPDASKNRGIDICIGWNEDFTKPSQSTLTLVEDYFRSRGYSVGLNTPYSNAKTVDTPADYNALMIEVNKQIYMDEDSLVRLDTFTKVKEDIQGLYRLLLE